jgi:N-acetylmuramoyl-L-alanine amidase
MHAYQQGESGPAVAEIRGILAQLGLLDSFSEAGDRAEFDKATTDAVREFQQSRGLNVDGTVGEETWRALEAARWKLGDRTLYLAMPAPYIGDDVRTLQERLQQMGYDVGRADGIYGVRTSRGVSQFQREVGLSPDGAFGPSTMAALRRLERSVRGGNAQLLREEQRFRHSGPTLVGKTIVVDPGHGGPDLGATVRDGVLRWTEADLAYDIATRLEGRLAAAGMRVTLTRGPRPASAISDEQRAELANALNADLVLSVHLERHDNPLAHGVATYHYGSSAGTSTVGERLAGLVQREIVARTGLLDCHTHAKTWDLLRLTRMPAMRVDVGYLTSPSDRAKLIDPAFRDRVVEAMIAAVQRMYFPIEQDVKTGSIDVSGIRASLPTTVG